RLDDGPARGLPRARRREVIVRRRIALLLAAVLLAAAPSVHAARTATTNRIRPAIKRARPAVRRSRLPRRGSPRAFAQRLARPPGALPLPPSPDRARARGTVLIALDIDGVLAPIVKQPGRARIPKKTRDALHRLAAIPGVELA